MNKEIIDKIELLQSPFSLSLGGLGRTHGFQVGTHRLSFRRGSSVVTKRVHIERNFKESSESEFYLV